MKDQHDENKPLYSSRGIETYLKLIKQKYNYIDIDKLLKYALMESYQVRDEGHLFSQKQINLFYEKLVQLTGNPRIAHEAGRFASTPEVLGSLRRSILCLIGPIKYYELIGKYASKITKSSRYQARKLGANKVEITVTPYPGTREEPFQCENRMGYWEAVSTGFNLNPPRILHPECMFQGGKVCRYIVSWQESPATLFKRIKNISTMTLAAICIISPFLIKQVTPSFPPGKTFLVLYSVSITIILLLNLISRRLDVDHLLQTINSLKDSADELMEQVEINYENSLLVSEMSQVLAKTLDIDGIFSEVTRVLRNRLDYDRALVMLADPQKTRLHFQAGYGYTEEQLHILKKIAFHLDNPKSKGIFTVTFQQMKPMLLNDLDDIKNDLSPRSLEFARKFGVKSLICCPITYKDDPLGILAVDNIKSKKPLLQRDLNVMMGVTLQIGAKIHNVQLESHLRQSQKMEAMGNLASGIAHDFNNILSTILGYSQIIGMKLPGNDPIRKMAEEIHHAGIKASNLTKQLLAFSRKQVTEMKITSLNIIIEDMAKMLGRLISEDISLEIFPAKEIGNIMADTGQIEQIIMNLVVNARDAMPAGGHLIIETGEIFLDEKYAETHENVAPGSYVMLTVTDTGKGVPKAIREKIFEPFFTTKELGKGTGLGLFTVFGIVKQHNGHIYIYSEPDQGTTFKIYLPVVEGPIDEIASSRKRKMPGGTETILVVDDDPSIRRLIEDTLEPLGYHLIKADCGREALDRCRATKEKIDLVLTDVIMPGMNGLELIETIKIDRPEIKAILMSGYTDNVVTHHGVLKPGIIFINKPLLPIAMANKIREVLDNKPATT
ncbi:blue-light-activated protein [bacterium BMS3Bbin14]|nr:blue-light-activated protein [bacterium BMS3Bbin14]